MDRHAAAVKIQVRACCLAFLHKRRAPARRSHHPATQAAFRGHIQRRKYARIKVCVVPRLAGWLRVRCQPGPPRTQRRATVSAQDAASKIQARAKAWVARQQVGGSAAACGPHWHWHAAGSSLHHLPPNLLPQEKKRRDARESDERFESAMQRHMQRIQVGACASDQHQRAPPSARSPARSPSPARHRPPPQVLERERQELRQLPLEQLNARDRQRHLAATAIQACWRSYSTRRRLRALLPAAARRWHADLAGDASSSSSRSLAAAASQQQHAGARQGGLHGSLDALAAAAAEVQPCRISAISSQRLKELSPQVRGGLLQPSSPSHACAA